MLNILSYHGILSLKNPSPLIRTCGLKIINEILYTNYIPIEDIIKKIEPLVNESWWEIKA